MSDRTRPSGLMLGGLAVAAVGAAFVGAFDGSVGEIVGVMLAWVGGCVAGASDG